MRFLFAVVVLAVGLTSLVLAQDSNVQSQIGKVVLAVNTFKFEAGEIYETVVDGNDFQPGLGADYQNFNMAFPSGGTFDPNKRFTYRVFLVAKKSGELPVLVTYPGIPQKVQPAYDYKISVRHIPISKTLLLEKKDTLAKNDPVYAERNSPHKAYPITLKKDKFYVIDMVRPRPANFNVAAIDPFLYLEDTKPANNFQKVVARDDDSGGDLNARIIYQATKDGDFRIIATSLGKAEGPFTLTVHGQE